MKCISTIILFFCSVVAFAQRLPEADLYKVRITEPDKSIVFETAPVSSLPKPSADRTYYWYSANVIHTTQGGYSGKLLNGNFNEYYLNKSLKQQGVFKKGLKDGTWKRWDEKGILLEIITWQKGDQSGEFQFFDEHGKLKQSGTYQHGQFDGEMTTYVSGKAEVITYKDGKAVQAKAPFWKRINVFKKKKAKEVKA